MAVSPERRRDLRLPLTAAVAIGLAYLPFLAVGGRVFGYLGGYVQEAGSIYAVEVVPGSATSDLVSVAGAATQANAAQPASDANAASTSRVRSDISLLRERHPSAPRRTATPCCSL